MASPSPVPTVTVTVTSTATVTATPPALTGASSAGPDVLGLVIGVLISGAFIGALITAGITLWVNRKNRQSSSAQGPAAVAAQAMAELMEIGDAEIGPRTNNQHWGRIIRGPQEQQRWTAAVSKLKSSGVKGALEASSWVQAIDDLYKNEDWKGLEIPWPDVEEGMSPMPHVGRLLVSWQGDPKRFQERFRTDTAKLRDRPPLTTASSEPDAPEPR